MSRPRRAWAGTAASLLLCLAWVVPSESRAQAAPGPAASGEAQPANPAITELPDGRLRIGAIIVDRKAQRFTVPGKVLRTAPPLEYLAVGPGGFKDYESLLELEARGDEFNLACILIGLDPPKERYEFHSDTSRIAAPPVQLKLAWTDAAGKRQAVAAEQALALDGKPVEDGSWVYTGSIFDHNNAYAAAVTGTLIGFVHDPIAVIEHAGGLGLGDYGSMAGNELLLRVGMEVELEVATGRP